MEKDNLIIQFFKYKENSDIIQFNILILRMSRKKKKKKKKWVDWGPELRNKHNQDATILSNIFRWIVKLLLMADKGSKIYKVYFVNGPWK